MRTIDNTDIEAAIRGLRMRKRMPNDELYALVEKHCDNPLFASQVIAQAARRVLGERVLKNWTEVET